MKIKEMTVQQILDVGGDVEVIFHDLPTSKAACDKLVELTSKMPQNYDGPNQKIFYYKDYASNLIVSTNTNGD